MQIHDIVSICTPEGHTPLYYYIRVTCVAKCSNIFHYYFAHVSIQHTWGLLMSSIYALFYIQYRDYIGQNNKTELKITPLNYIKCTY